MNYKKNDQFFISGDKKLIVYNNINIKLLWSKHGEQQEADFHLDSILRSFYSTTN